LQCARVLLPFGVRDVRGEAVPCRDVLRAGPFDVVVRFCGGLPRGLLLSGGVVQPNWFWSVQPGVRVLLPFEVHVVRGDAVPCREVLRAGPFDVVVRFCGGLPRGPLLSGGIDHLHWCWAVHRRVLLSGGVTCPDWFWGVQPGVRVLLPFRVHVVRGDAVPCREVLRAGPGDESP